MIMKYRLLFFLLALCAVVAKAQTDIPEQYLGLGLPLINITTADGEEPTSTGIMHPDDLNGASITDVVAKEARMQIYRADTLWYDSGEYLKDEAGIKIKHRGNTSAYYYENKPFKLSLQKKANLIPAEEGDTVNRKSKDWVLLNNAERLRVFFANQMSRLIDMEYTPRLELVNVIINGDYRGIYMLSENVKRDKSCRIDVDKENGYIIELDSYFWNETFSIPSKLTRFLQWTLKYPKPEDLTPEQEADIRSDIARFESSVSAADYPEVMDVHSMARWILLHDIVGTHDPGGSNIYVARKNREPSSLMRMPVVWDVGSSMENPESFSRTHTERGLFFYHLFANGQCTDFSYAYMDEWKRVCQLGAIGQMRQFLQSFPTSAIGQGLKRSYPLHTKRWHFGTADVDAMTQEALDWYNNREGWLNEQIAEMEKEVAARGPVRILCIGNSYSADMVESWLAGFAQTSNIQLVVGNAARAGYGLRTYWQNLETGSPVIEYRKLKDGNYTSSGGHTLAEIINDEPWDYITFQQNSEESGLYSTYAPYLRNLINYVKGVHPEAKLGWVMTWAYAQDFDGSGFLNYQNNQMVMYDSIRNAVSQMLVDYPEIEFVVPCGTAVQNLRSSFLGDRVNRDGTHLNIYIGRYLAAYTFLATMFGEEVAIGNSYLPYFTNDFTMRVIRSAALDAVRNPFAVTPQVYPDYVGDNSIFPNDININFTAERVEPVGWNNLGLHHNFLAGLKDIDGMDPGIFIFTNAEFSGEAYNGPSVTDTPLNMPAAVSKTQLYGYSEGNISGVPKKPQAVIQFHHLNKSLAYDFTFFASQENVMGNRETQFTLAGADTFVATIDTSDKRNNIANIFDVYPDDDGTITLTVSAGSNNNSPYKLYQLNALRISAYDPNDPNSLTSVCDDSNRNTKFIKDGHLYIIKDGRIYTPDGKRIK